MNQQLQTKVENISKIKNKQLVAKQKSVKRMRICLCKCLCLSLCKEYVYLDKLDKLQKRVCRTVGLTLAASL